MEREELIKLIMKRIYTRRIYAEGLADDILRLFSVSQQRELLLAFAEWKEYNGKWQTHENQVKDFLKEYKANNCG